MPNNKFMSEKIEEEPGEIVKEIVNALIGYLIMEKLEEETGIPNPIKIVIKLREAQKKAEHGETDKC